MFETIGRGWNITKLSLNVVRQDKEMLLFPALGGVFSVVYALLVMWPALLSQAMDPQQTSFAWGSLQTVAVFATYFGLAFIATFFNTCTVYTAKTRFAGGDATFKDSIAFALSRVHLILGWSVVAASVGMLLRALDQMANRAEGIGGVLFELVDSLLGMMWSVLTVFVVPVMVYEQVGPFQAIRRSGEVLRRTWGESLVRYFGLGLIQFAASLPGILLAGLGFSGLWPLVILGAIWVILVALTFSVANTVFNTALYEYAGSGRIPGGFDPETMRGAFGPRRGRQRF